MVADKRPTPGPLTHVQADRLAVGREVQVLAHGATQVHTEPVPRGVHKYARPVRFEAWYTLLPLVVGSNCTQSRLSPLLA